MRSYSSCVVLALVALMAAVTASNTPSDMFGSYQPKSDGVADKRLLSDEIDMDKRTFIMGSRYGRSSPSVSVYGRSGRVNVSPRNDRFFLGSRYGKRSTEYPLTVTESEPVTQQNIFSMTCTYTGFKDYYRCSKVNDINNFIQRLSSEEVSTSV